jgi:ATP-binding cassette, subfamily B (MDR/TAP), member 1
MLQQNIGFFDHLGAGEITTRISVDTLLIQDGISEKLGLTLNSLSTFISAFVIAFIRYWKLTLILSSTVFAIFFSISVASLFMIKWAAETQARYAASGAVAEEVFGSIRNVTAFNTQEKHVKQYNEFLTAAGKHGKKLQGALGIMSGIMMCILYLSYVSHSNTFCFFRRTRHILTIY